MELFYEGILGLPSPGQVTSAKTELKTRTLLLAQLLLKEVGRGKFQYKFLILKNLNNSKNDRN